MIHVEIVSLFKMSGYTINFGLTLFVALGLSWLTINVNKLKKQLAFFCAGNGLSFTIDNNLAFEIPLNNVSHTTTAKNEVTLEFHQNDDAAVSLMELRFHIPPDPSNAEKDTRAQVQYRT